MGPTSPPSVRWLTEHLPGVPVGTAGAQRVPGAFPDRATAEGARIVRSKDRPIAIRRPDGTSLSIAAPLDDEKAGATALVFRDPVHGQVRHGAALANLQQVARIRSPSLHRKDAFQAIERVRNLAVVAPGHLLPRRESQNSDAQRIGSCHHLAAFGDVWSGVGFCYRSFESPYALRSATAFTSGSVESCVRCRILHRGNTKGVSFRGA